jgi:cyclopropane fatty-acyl-phospholipid synthase-like methyltransferase
MSIDIIKHKKILLYLRRLLDLIPLALYAYKCLWRLRTSLEYKFYYPKKQDILYFGSFDEPSLDELTSQLCTASQIMTRTYRKWCDLLQSPARFSRKQWEFVFILQALSSAGKLKTGMHGLGFGCGREPLPGIFSKFGCIVTATDLEPDAAQHLGWVESMQHAASIEELYLSCHRIVSKPIFHERVQFQPVNMNQIPSNFFNQYDFVWSACALEHLGSLHHGMDFIKNSLKCLKPGGMAVHTTEFNLSSNELTLETSGCSIYREKDIRQLIQELEPEGYLVKPLNLNTGGSSVDSYIDAPPYGLSPHLKLELANYLVTSIGIIITKK